VFDPNRGRSGLGGASNVAFAVTTPAVDAVSLLPAGETSCAADGTEGAGAVAAWSTSF